MSTSRLPLDVKQLLTAHIDSVGQLEVLLVFFNNQKKIWSVAELSQELRSHEGIITQQVASLEKSGFLKKVSERTFAFTDDEILKKQAAELHQAYREMSVAVIAHIYEKPNDKLKGFADAFKLKKE